MEMVILFGLIFLVIYSIFVIGLFFCSIKKKSKIGLTISSFVIFLVVLLLLTNTIDEFTISKKDVVSDLKYIGVALKDNFEIKNNRVTGMPERIQVTEIKITKEDRERIINEIKSSSNFKSFASAAELINDTVSEQLSGSDKIFNFKYPEFYSRKIYTKVDNYPTRIYLSIFENNNTVTFQKIEE